MGDSVAPWVKSLTAAAGGMGMLVGLLGGAIIGAGWPLLIACAVLAAYFVRDLRRAAGGLREDRRG